MPPNFKIPIIKVTPSSPTQDPNDPEYPEYFEGKLYKYCLFKSLCEDESGDVAIIAAENPIVGKTNEDDNDDDDIVFSFGGKTESKDGEMCSSNRDNSFNLVWQEEESQEKPVEESNKNQDKHKDDSGLDDSLKIVYESLATDKAGKCEMADSQMDEDELDDEADTPDIEVQIEIAEKRKMPQTVVENMKKVAKICDNVVILDWRPKTRHVHLKYSLLW